VDLEAQRTIPALREVFTLQVARSKKHCLMNGLGDIGLNMEKAASIRASNCCATGASLGVRPMAAAFEVLA